MRRAISSSPEIASTGIRLRSSSRPRICRNNPTPLSRTFDQDIGDDQIVILDLELFPCQIGTDEVVDQQTHFLQQLHRDFSHHLTVFHVQHATLDLGTHATDQLL